MQVEVADDVSLYAPPDRPWELKLRSRQSFQLKLQGVVRLWKAMATARGDDADQIDVSYVVRRLLEASVDAAFAEFGGIPRDDSGWEAIESAIVKAAKKNR